MTYVVISACIACKYSDCVDACPTDAFHEGPNMLVINPEDCIDCGLCQPVCPVKAICGDDEIPSREKVALEINERLSKTWPNIVKKKPALPDAKIWGDVQNKWPYLEEYECTPYAEIQLPYQE